MKGNAASEPPSSSRSITELFKSGKKKEGGFLFLYHAWQFLLFDVRSGSVFRNKIRISISTL